MGEIVTQTPIEVLRREHALARRMVQLLLRLANEVEAAEGFPAADIAEVLGFFREFVETEHHAKEDGTVYPLALAHGGDDEAEVVGQLIADHEATKELLHSLTLFWEPTGLLDNERGGFCALARNYGRRLLRHMDLEESVLFPVAATLDADERRRTLDAFARISASHPSLESWLAVAARLEERWA